MELKIIQRNDRPEDVVLIPSHTEGIFATVVPFEADDGPGGFKDVIGKGILLESRDQTESLANTYNNVPDEFLRMFVLRHPQKIGGYILGREIKATLYECINRNGDLVNAQTMETKFFTEYTPQSAE